MGMPFTLRDGVWYRDGDFEGDPDGVCGKCKCGHYWRLSGVVQIIDLGPSAGDPTYD
jgi:hypothetical protein